MYVCLSVWWHVSKTAFPKLTIFSVQVNCGLSSDLLWRQCDTLCTSGFVDNRNVMFPCNGGNRPESKTMRLFRSIRQMAAPGAKSAAPTASCFLWLGWVLWSVFSAVTLSIEMAPGASYHKDSLPGRMEEEKRRNLIIQVHFENAGAIGCYCCVNNVRYTT